MLCVVNNSGNVNCNCDSCCEKKAIESLIRDAALWKKKRDRAIRATRLTQFTLNKGFLKNLLTRNESFNDRLKTHSKVRQENAIQEQPSTSKDDDLKIDSEKSIRLKSHKKKRRSRSSSTELDSTSSDEDYTSSSSDSSIEVIIAKKRKRKKYKKMKHSRKCVSPSSSPTYEDLKKCINKSFYTKYFKIPKESISKSKKSYLKHSVKIIDDDKNLEESNKTLDSIKLNDSNEIAVKETECAKESQNESPLRKESTKKTSNKVLLEKSENHEKSKHDKKHLENKTSKSSHKSRRESAANDNKRVKTTSQNANSLYSDDEEGVFLKIVPVAEKSKKVLDKVNNSQDVENTTEEKSNVKASETKEGKDITDKVEPTEKVINEVDEFKPQVSKNDIIENSADKVDQSMDTGQSKISFSLNSKVNKTVDKPTEFQQQEQETSDQSERKKLSSRLKKHLKKSKKKSKKMKRKYRSPEKKAEKPKIEEKERSRSRDKDNYSQGRRRSSSYDTPKSTSRRRSYTKSPSRYSKASYSSGSSKGRYRSYSRSRSRSYRSYSRSFRDSRSHSRRKYSSSRYSYSSADRRSSSYRNSRSSSRHRSRSRSSTKSRGRRSMSFSYVYTNPEKARKYYKRSVSSSSSDSDRSRRKYK